MSRGQAGETFLFFYFGAGWSSPVARQAHNLKVAGSNPAPATKRKIKTKSDIFWGIIYIINHSSSC